MTHHVFVMGPDAFNRRRLKRIERREGCVYHELLSESEVVAEEFSFSGLLEKAERTLHESEYPVDAIIGFWDFPTTTLVPALCQRFGLPTPTLTSVLKCEHKYWSRLIQQEEAPDIVPQFQALDPFDDRAVETLTIEPPFWIKPVKAHSSQLGYRIDEIGQLGNVLPEIRSGIPKLGDPFNEALDLIELPEPVRPVHGRHCIVEKLIGGEQCTLEGHVSEGKVEIYGVVDSVRYFGVSSFQRYQYPSRLPTEVTDRMTKATARVMRRIGYDHGLFNIEFYFDEDADRIWLLEINPRPSQSHADIFEKVDGISHQWLLLQFALGRDPIWEPGKGAFPCAAKFFIRRFGKDARVVRLPDRDTLARLEKEIPGCEVRLDLTPGMRLSELTYQDSYSFELARVHLGGHDTRDLLGKYRRVTDALEFELEEVDR